MYKDYRLVLVRRHCMELPWLLSCNRYSFNLALPAEILCPELEVSQGTINTTNGYRTSSVATVQCSDGYRLSGQSSLTCQITGEWTDDEPTCERKGISIISINGPCPSDFNKTWHTYFTNHTILHTHLLLITLVGNASSVHTYTLLTVA